MEPTVNDLDLPGRGRAILGLYGQAHVAGWEPYNLQYLAQVAWVGSALYRSRTTSHNGRICFRRSIS